MGEKLKARGSSVSRSGEDHDAFFRAQLFWPGLRDCPGLVIDCADSDQLHCLTDRLTFRVGQVFEFAKAAFRGTRSTPCSRDTCEQVLYMGRVW